MRGREAFATPKDITAPGGTLRRPDRESRQKHGNFAATEFRGKK